MAGMTRQVADCTTGEISEIALTPEEVADRQAAAAADAAARSDATQRQAAIQQARPPSGVLVKLRDNVALTTPELQAVVRYLALREFREAQG